MYGDGGGPKDIDLGRVLNCAPTTNMLVEYEDPQATT